MKLVRSMDAWKRLELLIGNNALNQLQSKTVLIVGLGGVGGYALEALARSGIGTLILVDHDVIEETNINRQLIALHSTIGYQKVDAWKDRIKEINPNCKIITKNIFLTKENIQDTLSEKIDYIVDACDTISTKMELIRYSIKNNIKMISSMGMGNKLDPSKLSIMELHKTSYDPIAKVLRKMMREEHITSKVMTVSSTEQPLSKTNEVIASNAFVPAIAGLLCASYVVRDIIGEK